MNNGLAHLYILALAIDPRTPSTVYAGTEGGVYKTRNSGDSWEPINNGLNGAVRTLAIDPQYLTTIYAGGGGVYKSTNGGETWTPINNGLTSSGFEASITSLAVDPKTPNNIYAGTVPIAITNPAGTYITYGGGVYKTTDGGMSWTHITSALPESADVLSLVVDPQTPATIFAAVSGDVYKSTDGGASWHSSHVGQSENTVQVLAIDPQTPSTIYAGTWDGIYKSTDGGEKWNLSNDGLRVSWINVLAVDPQSPGTVYAGSNASLYKTSDGGSNWHLSNNGLLNARIEVMAIDPQTPATIFAGTLYEGLYKSTDGGKNWNPVNNGLPNRDFQSLAIDPQEPATIYALTSPGVYKSIDGGGSWKNSQGSPDNVFKGPLVIDPQNPSILYAANFNGGVYKSTDGGESWDTSNKGLEEIDHYALVLSLAIDPQNPSTVYAGTFDWGVFKSTDSGANWKTTSSIAGNQSQFGPPIFALAIDLQNPSTIYAGAGGGLFKTTDGGGSWTHLGGPDIRSLALDPQSPATIYAGSDGVYRSTDGGVSWTPMNQGLTNLSVTALAIDPKNPSRIYAGTGGGGVFVTSVADCSNSISPLSQSYSSSGIVRDQVKVAATGDCGWTATSNDPWITILSGTNSQGTGTVAFSVLPNTDPGSRRGTLTIAGQSFAITQAGLTTPFSISSIAPDSGPVTGGTSVTLDGGGFQVGASVMIGGVPARISALTSDQITATTGIARTAGGCDVEVTNPGGQSIVLTRGFTYTPVSGLQTGEIFVPIVLSSVGMNGSFYTSELTLTNRGTGNATANFTYTASMGSGSGAASDTLAPSQQKIVPDAISYLRNLGVPIPSSGRQGGTLKVSFSGLTSPADGSVTVRTTTTVPQGRAGLAYGGIPSWSGLTDPSYINGLRQNQTDRSNVAIQNVGSPSDGDITLRLTVFSGTKGLRISKVLLEQVLAPGGFAQINEILTSNGLELSNGYVRIERVNGKAPYYAYGVINDQANSDGSFVPPIPESALAGKTRLALPVVVETELFSTELVITNGSSTRRTLIYRYVADAIQTADHAASFTIDIEAGQQLIQPELVEWLRDSQVAGIGARGPTYGGALFISSADGDLSGIAVAARTSAAGGGGEYGLFYTASPEGTNSQNEAWLYGLQQNSENRTNLALVNTGEIDSSQDTFIIELYDGETGKLANTITGVTLAAREWKQFNMPLSEHAPQGSQGYAHVVRNSGNNPFIAYAVVNDGNGPGERTGDGAFIASSP